MTEFLLSGYGLAIFGAVLACMGFFCMFVFNKALANERELAAYKTHVAEHYVKKEELIVISQKLDLMETHNQERWKEIMNIFLENKRGNP